MSDFNEKLESFIEGCQKLINENYSINFKNLTHPVLKLDGGKKYLRISLFRPDGTPDGGVYCFIDTTNGDVLKPASYKAPAKHARGNIFDNWNGLKHMGPYGPAYLR